MGSLHDFKIVHQDHDPKEVGLVAPASWTAATQCNGVTALALATAKDWVFSSGSNQSGDSADSVAAVQDLAARFTVRGKAPMSPSERVKRSEESPEPPGKACGP